MLNICIVFAQLERETIQKRVTDAYYSRNKKGFFMGGRVPYGFKLEPIVIDGIRTSFIWIKCRFRCMNSRQMATTNKGKSSWLVGKVKCGNCGKGLQISPSRVSKKTGKSIRYMNCSYKYITKGLGCSGTGSRIYADELENYVLKQIKGKLAEFEGLNEQNATQTNPRLNENKIRLAQIDKEIDDLVGKVSGANSVLMRYINEKVEQLDAFVKVIKIANGNIEMTWNI